MTSVGVIGAGLMGAATAWRLVQRGHEVTVLERSWPANEWGSSRGSARIFRYAYANPFYSALVCDARTAWNDLETAANQRLITRHGALDFGVGRDPRMLAAILDGVGVENEVMSSSAVRDRWGIEPDTDEALWHADAGVLDAQGAVSAMLALASAGGARVETGWTVQRIEQVGAGYRIVPAQHDTAPLEVEQVVVAAGGWLPELLAHLPLPARFLSALPQFEVWQEQVFHFPYRDDERDWPTLIHKSDDIQVYALPGGRDAGGRGQKVAEFQGGHPIAGMQDMDRIINGKGRDRIIAYVRAHLPGLVPEPYAEATCLFTMTPTEDFVIDRCEGITVLSPCSGHGAKFSPLIGALAADLVEARDIPSIFRPGSRNT